MLHGCAAVCLIWIILWVKNSVLWLGRTTLHRLLRPYNNVSRHLCLDRMSFWWCAGGKVKKFRTPEKSCVCIEGKEQEMPTSTAISMVGIKMGQSTTTSFTFFISFQIPSPHTLTLLFPCFHMVLFVRSGPQKIMLTISILLVYGAKWIKFHNTLLIYEHITILIIQVRKKLRAKKVTCFKVF